MIEMHPARYCVSPSVEYIPFTKENAPAGVVLTTVRDAVTGAVGQYASMPSLQVPSGNLKLSPATNPAGVKHDSDKLRYDLLPPLALEELVKVLTHGAKKYDDDNWRNVPNWKKRYFAATQRHQWQWKQGIIQDDAPDAKGSPGSHCHHIACAIASLMFLLEKELEGETNA